MLYHITTDIHCIDETKLDDSSPDSQFKMEEYQFSVFSLSRGDMSDGDDPKIAFVKEDPIVNRLKSLRKSI